MPHINWDYATLVMMFNQSLTEEQREEGMELIKYGKHYYKQDSNNIPQCIVLVSKQGVILQEIQIKGGLDYNECITLPSPIPLYKNKKVLLAIGIIIAYTIYVRK